MRLPVKLNKAWWPGPLRRLFRAAEDPRALLQASIDKRGFSRAVSALKFGATFKSTGSARFPQTLEQLAALEFQRAPAVLDVGASDGSTSLDVMEAIDFRRYYCTDLNPHAYTAEHQGWTYFFTSDGAAMVAASDRWVVYNDLEGAIPPFGFLTTGLFARAPQMGPDARRIELINPSLRARSDSRVAVLRYSVLEAWTEENVDLIVAANILNRAYFSTQQLERIVANLRAALLPAGRIAFVDNREAEHASIVSMTAAGPRVHARVGRGAEVEELAMRVLSSSDDSVN
jgi:hypothetical protein